MTTTTESQLAKALAHPLRARILTALADQERSPGDLATELGAPLGVVSYHVRMLRDYECVELVRTEPRRGALQHYYRATVNGPRVVQQGDDDARLARYEAALKYIAGQESGQWGVIARTALDGTVTLPIRP